MTVRDNKNFEGNLAATLKALVADESLDVEFFDAKSSFFSWNQDLIVGEKKVVIPRFRAASDLAACYFLFHDCRIHQEKNFAENEQKIFDEFEKIRVIANVKNLYRGVAQNILQKIEDDVCFVLPNLSLLLLDYFFSDWILPKMRAAISDLKKITDKKILSQIQNLGKKISNQREFVWEIEKLFEMLRKEKELLKKRKEKGVEQEIGEKKHGVVDHGEQIPKQVQDDILPLQGDVSSPQGDAHEIKHHPKPVSGSVFGSNNFTDEIEFKNPYKIYSSHFDEIIFPQKLVAKNELDMLRDQLDLRLAKLSSISRKMSLKLKKKLLSKRDSFLEFDSSRGILDRKKLTRLILDPMQNDVWINSKVHEYQDIALTILLDNSGSMRGNPIVMSALACEIIAQILEKFFVKTEIIGFTTADWRGGRVRKLWESARRPKNPGRLNELRHIIYKHFNQRFGKARVNLGLMLKEGILKENIDGEALLFARSRLMQQSEKRKILLVISDGTPVDDSTLSANDNDILSDHLHHVVNKIEKSGKIEIVAIGIGHSAGEFYRNSITIKNSDELGDVMIEKITQLL
ncbi:MAG: hypothetical protein A2887_04380 [Alphaproteobacteria bacterium RIFCSPLOWO2_01_FULL_40_26]|nr:MAG: hypothetical protein A3D15_01565 [Alphaproteobacteria bacterium RIFCSPHIGHO2_02_FULL_40_34]OFW94461.1 MAG: hypothetical protein A2887_04380 [Alphaproteobacteria bacterium RIFCSPLOWO2_01_FULL_40_26]OFX09531.1 MAG: hypothetical protein A3H30_05580 [Alphaproteobacteria bacterium RIFCSPLOWO2_02_FULL_40_19]OFX10681.1 MAG: hypothetical protein A3G22_06840 [Alphaproteobacteria bacterium RIFCSPLOWO2_12_FULL_40_11]